MSSENTDLNLEVDQNDLLDYEPVKPTSKDQIKDQDIPVLKKNNIYSCYKNTPPLWEDVVGTINYIDLSSHSFHQMLYVLHDDVRDTRPKWITVCCFDKVALTLPNKTIIDSCEKLIKLVEQEGIHNISFGTIQFPPEFQSKWQKLGQLNAKLRVLNIDRNIPPLTLHKALMKHMFEKNRGPLLVKGNMWVEFTKQTGLGKTVSPAGLRKLKSFLLQAVRLQFVEMDRIPSNRWLGTIQPPPLNSTDDYTTNPTMCHFLREKGEFNQRSKSTSTAQAQVEQPQRSVSTSNIPVVPQPTGASATEEGASATEEEKRKDQQRSRPITWHGQNIQVRYRPGNNTRKVVTEDDSSAFSDTPKDQDNYNESDLRNTLVKRKAEQQSFVQQTTSFEQEIATISALQDQAAKVMQNRVSMTKPVQDLANELLKVKTENEERKEQEETLKKEISKLNKYLDAEEEDNKKYKKQVEKLKLDNAALLLEKDCALNTQLNLERSLKNKSDQIKMLEDSYAFLKTMHDDRTEWIQKELKKKDKKSKKE